MSAGSKGDPYAQRDRQNRRHRNFERSRALAKMKNGGADQGEREKGRVPQERLPVHRQKESGQDRRRQKSSERIQARRTPAAGCHRNRRRSGHLGVIGGQDGTL